MKYRFSFEKGNDGYNKIILPEEIKLIEYVFEDMESFGEPIFQSFVEKVVNKDSNYEGVSGNICSLEINRDFTTVSTEFFTSEMVDECKIETDELMLLILAWIDENKEQLQLN
ncbi:hypothetical protein [Clostridium felsineum]|uniref:Antitoxin n=1 Tax=Clostridium felsineum TaxID=36839 RepID=A0A1S8L581_9CLOT|nr:hypothetical protein [Clostridium felsineum]URZ05798.1 Antitoxin [Clostridium felsineum]URZ10837.1 Antitoxin [Clostridium felsineum]